ncbi:GNAT family N-acetyltransferase [Ktedonospora formicarum]|uniref:N-acetyltransferase domain-containing protein n=1 Tax=Ktedonospora formicarum TaxID=2778364 RepID=A0A8J3IA26_9CHLR|nr:GNAT family N-acetyltransferase [Ktedonospora formicarum]GHO49560.1 hypothetical protein KSX_77230 [Ktedonospora formicarum]
MRTRQESTIFRNQAGYISTWWRGDPLPTLSSTPDLYIERSENVEALAHVMECPREEVSNLLRKGHEAYIARIGAQPVAVGWSARREAGFGGGLVTFRIPEGNRYLYDFVTLPAWRGRGIYPHLLQYILKAESSTNERFWIVYQFTNTASKRGIEKAGFRLASNVCFLDDGSLGLVPPPDAFERARACARLVGLPLIAGFTKDQD